MVWLLVAAAGAPLQGLPALQARVDEAPAMALPALNRSRPAELAVVDCAGLTHTQRVSLMFLQGLANRPGPRLFLRGLASFNARADDWWLERLRDEYGIGSRRLERTDALREFGGELDGLVVWDDDLPGTENIAAMLGALFSWLPCAPGDLDGVREASGLAVACDLRRLWDDHLELHRWALAHLVPKLPRRDIGCVCARDAAGHLCRDWLIRQGAVVVDLSSHEETEKALKDDFYSRIEDGSVVWGWTSQDNEGEHVAQASRHGLRVLCTTNSPNLSVFAQLEPKRTSWRQPRCEPPDTIERKVYLACVLTDGDSIPILLTRQWYRWDEAARGTVPFGWEIQPLFAELAPTVLEYYYDSASPQDRFIAGPSGAGYVHPSLLPDRDWFARETARWCEPCDVDLVGVIDGYDADMARTWARGFRGAKGFVYGWGASPGTPARIVEGKPHLHYGLCPPQPGEAKDAAYYEVVAQSVREYARRWDLPCVLVAHLSCYWAGPDDVPRLVEALGDLPVEVVPVDTALEIAGRLLRDRVLVVAEPAEVVDGMVTRWSVTLTSTFGEPVKAEVEVTLPEGLRAEPARRTVELAADSESTEVGFVLSGRGTEDGEVRVAVRARGKTWRSRAAVRRHALSAEMPAGAYEVAGAFEAEDLAHNSGRAIEDQAASGGVAWEAVEGTDEGGTHVVWGPYQPLPAGEYLVAFRLRGDVPAPEGVVLDVFDYYRAQEGKEGLLARAGLAGGTLGESYSETVLPFRREEAGKTEYRVWWGGKGRVVVDRVTVLRRAG